MKLCFTWQVKESAENGFAAAQHKLAAFYLKGIGVPRDRDKAIEWFNKAAANGDERAKAELRNMGLGVPSS